MSWLSFLGQRDDAGRAEDRENEPGETAQPGPALEPDAAGSTTDDVPSREDSADGSWNFEALVPEPPAPAPGTGITSDPLKTLELKPHVIEALSTVFDPEIPVNIYELGLIYDVIIDAEARVHVQMTLTSPACPAAQQLPGEVQDKVRKVPGVKAAAVEIVWDPPWSPDRMSDVARLQLGFF